MEGLRIWNYDLSMISGVRSPGPTMIKNKGALKVHPRLFLLF
jgi:hypothetical protein